MSDKPQITYSMSALENLAQRYIPFMVLDNETLHRIIQENNNNFKYLKPHIMFKNLWNSDRYEELKDATFFGILKLVSPRKELGIAFDFVNQSIDTDEGLPKIEAFLLYIANQIKNQQEKHQLQTINDTYQIINPQDSGELAILKKILQEVSTSKEKKEFFENLTQEIKNIVSPPQEKSQEYKTSPRSTRPYPFRHEEQPLPQYASLTLNTTQKNILKATIGISAITLILFILHKTKYMKFPWFSR